MNDVTPLTATSGALVNAAATGNLGSAEAAGNGVKVAAVAVPASPLLWMRWVPALVLTLVVTVVVLIASNVIIVPLLASLALAYLLAPAVAWMERRGWQRSSAVLLVLTAATLLLVLALIFLVPSLWEQLTRSYEQISTLLSNRQKARPILNRLQQASPPVYKMFSGYIERFFLPEEQARYQALVMGWLRSGLFQLVNATSSIMDALLVPFFVYYLLSDYRAMRRYVEQIVPPRYRRTMSSLLTQINGVISSYVRNQLLIALIMGLLYTAGFMSLRVPLPVTLGMLSGLFNFIPYLGTLTGLALSLVFSALDGAGFARLGAILGVFALVQTLEGYYLTPKLLGDKLDLHPLWVLIGLVVGGNLFGLLGIILAVPVIAIGKVVLGFLTEIYRESNFYLRAGTKMLSPTTPQIAGTLVPETANTGNRTVVPANLILAPSTIESIPRMIITSSELQSRLREEADDEEPEEAKSSNESTQEH